MSGISLVGIHSAGGVILGPGDPTFTLDNAPIALLGDAVERHGAGEHLNPTLVEGSSTWTWNGKPIVRAGDAASCGHTANGHPTWSIT